MDLTDAYENGAYIPNVDAFRARWPEQSQAFRETASAQLNIRYGPAARNLLDLFSPKGTPRGLMVFVHGGYWRITSKDLWSHIAKGAVERGWAVAVPSYTLAPEARISEITREVASAVGVAAGLQTGPIVITGHSAGGHLSARMRCKGILPVDVATRVRRIVPISPLSDLRPLMQTDMNGDLQLDEDEAINESPALATNISDMDTLVWVGAEERPAFLDQARWLSEAWKCQLHIAPGRHHFDVIEELESADGALTQAVLGDVT